MLASLPVDKATENSNCTIDYILIQWFSIGTCCTQRISSPLQDQHSVDGTEDDELEHEGDDEGDNESDGYGVGGGGGVGVSSSDQYGRPRRRRTRSSRRAPPSVRAVTAVEPFPVSPLEDEEGEVEYAVLLPDSFAVLDSSFWATAIT